MNRARTWPVENKAPVHLKRDQFNDVVTSLLPSFPKTFVPSALLDEWPLLRVRSPSVDAQRVALSWLILEGLQLERGDTLNTNEEKKKEKQEVEGEMEVEEPDALQLIKGVQYLENTRLFILRTTPEDMDKFAFWDKLRQAITMADGAASFAERTNPPLNVYADPKSIDRVGFDVKRIKQFAMRCANMAYERHACRGLGGHNDWKEYIHDRIKDARVYAVAPDMASPLESNKTHLYSLAIVRSMIEQVRNPQTEHAMGHRRPTRRRFSIGVHTDSEQE